jgi:DeoR/GlpR family transcriptional regulator of sugar metabolism
MAKRKAGSGGRLRQPERHAQILAMLRRDGIVRVASLANAFAVTTETTRRDLDELAQSGALQRTYGGGAMRSLTDEPGIGLRGLVRTPERTRIAAAAAELVEPGDALMIDAGSTTSLFASVLAARNLTLTVVTNCLPVASALAVSDRCRVVVCPGDYVAHEAGVFGAETVAFIRRFHANKAFVGAGGITASAISDAVSAGCAVKRAMIERAERSLLLVDSSKFDVVQFEAVAPLAAIDDVVTEARPPRRLASALRQAGVNVTLAT